jgi:hypothetical protein
VIFLSFVLFFLYYFFPRLNFIYFSNDGEKTQRNKNKKMGWGGNKTDRGLPALNRAVCHERMLSLRVLCCCGPYWTKRSNTVAKAGLMDALPSSNRKGDKIIESISKKKKMKRGGGDFARFRN